jgi:hypothetical protein
VLLEYPIRSERSRFSLHPALARLGLRVTTTVRVVLPDGAVRAFELHGDPGAVLLDPRWHEAARQFVILGFRHILDGIDHLLFLLCLVVPLRKFRPLILVVTAFTIAHSITLVASAYDLAPGALWFPPLVETLIAGSIVYMALENVIGSTSATRRWGIAFAFGLVHGFGFSFALRDTLQFAGDHVLSSLLSFNLGVELGQLLVLALLVPALTLAFRYVVAERAGVIVLSVIVAHTAWHWMADRFAMLREFRVGWSDVHAALGGSGLPWLAVGLLVGMLAWYAARRLPSRRRVRAAGTSGAVSMRAVPRSVGEALRGRDGGT